MFVIRQPTAGGVVVATLTLVLGGAVCQAWLGAQGEAIPAGFTRLFDGRTPRGWHWSRTVHHGTTAIARVEGDALILQPSPFGQGGLLLTDRSYKDFEFYV